jgi:hypothetical protein
MSHSEKKGICGTNTNRAKNSIINLTDGIGASGESSFGDQG